MENLKDKIVQLLLDSSQQYGDTYEQRCIYDSDFNDVAELVVNIITQNLSDTLLTEIMVFREKNAELVEMLKTMVSDFENSSKSSSDILMESLGKAKQLIKSNITE